jgi:hypothetical protein
MTATMLFPPLVRALATALLVVSASAAAEALGPFWGAMIASLPVSAGPAYVFLAMRQGPDFVAASALSSFAANAATGLFLIVYVTLAWRAPPWWSLGCAVLAWLAASVVTQQVTWTPSTALVLNLLVYGTGFLMPGAVQSAEPQPVSPVRWRWPELVARALAVAGFVTLIVGVSSILGSSATGIAAVFPVSLIGLIVIVRPRIGGAAASLLAANALRSMLGFGVMLLVLHLAIRPYGIVGSFLAALAVSVVWSTGLLLFRRPRRAGEGG